MNDCIWWEVCACDAADHPCGHFEKSTSDKGKRIWEEYDRDVDDALRPVGEKYKRMMMES